MIVKASTTPEPQPLSKASASLALLAASLWGGNLVALKFGLITFPPLWSALWRFLLGVLVVAVWARWRGSPLIPQRRERTPLAVLSSLFTAQIVLLNVAMDLTSPAYGVVILNAYPVFSNLIGHFVASEERLSRSRLLGLALAFGGVCYLALGRPVEALAPNPLLGNWLLVVSALLLSIRTIYTRQLVQSIDPVRAVVWQCAGSLPFFLLGGVLFEPLLLKPVTWGPLIAILYQGALVAGVVFIIWTRLLRLHSAGTLTMFGFAVPFFGIVLSALVFDEPISGRILLAAGLVTLGIGIVTLTSARQRNK